jgi:DNA-binding HxlR family transcriptional regulator
VPAGLTSNLRFAIYYPPHGDASASPTIAPMPDPASAQPSSPPLSALGAALDRVGDRWSLLLVEALLAGPRRFGELGDEVAGIAPNILSDRLRRMERSGLLVATPYSRRPVRMEYALTADGRELAGALHLLSDWGARRGGVGEPLRHDVCGTPLEARWHCPTCDRFVEDDDPDELTRL